jgi:hypothetical protein
MWRWLVVYICDNYLLVELWMSLVIVYMLSGGELLSIAYIQVLVMLRWFVCVNICIVVESYVHAFMTDGGGFYIQLRWLRCFCCIEGDNLEVIWYHMHVCVELSISHCMSLDLFYSMMNDDDECAKWLYTCNDWSCYMNVDVEVKCSW